MYTAILRGLNEGDQVVMEIASADSFGFGFGAVQVFDSSGPPRSGVYRIDD
jgi:hypothetical protein